jgi:hypothetical protein
MKMHETEVLRSSPLSSDPNGAAVTHRARVGELGKNTGFERDTYCHLTVI